MLMRKMPQLLQILKILRKLRKCKSIDSYRFWGVIFNFQNLVRVQEKAKLGIHLIWPQIQSLDFQT